MSTVNSISALPSVTATEAPARSTHTDGRQATATIPLLKAQPSTAAPHDQADLSPASLLLSHALSLPDVRLDKVTAIQQALAKGTYHVSSADLADKLLTTLQS